MWALRGLLGGALIGAAASVLLVCNGRVAGISGILDGLLTGEGGDRGWRALFVIGLVLAGAVALALAPSSLSGAAPALGIAIAAGVAVGAGAKLGDGCTSGHGVCGISRFSRRSIVATITFIATGALTVWFVRAVLS